MRTISIEKPSGTFFKTCEPQNLTEATFPTVSQCQTLFDPRAVCPKCCTNLYQEQEIKPSLENDSNTPMLPNEVSGFLVGTELFPTTVVDD